VNVIQEACAARKGAHTATLNKQVCQGQVVHARRRCQIAGSPLALSLLSGRPKGGRGQGNALGYSHNVKDWVTCSQVLSPGSSSSDDGWGYGCSSQAKW